MIQVLLQIQQDLVPQRFILHLEVDLEYLLELALHMVKIAERLAQELLMGCGIDKCNKLLHLLGFIGALQLREY